MLRSGFSYPRNEETRPNQIKSNKTKCNQQHLQGIKHEVDGHQLYGVHASKILRPEKIVLNQRVDSGMAQLVTQNHMDLYKNL